jgi:SecD/SecF fusion protein
VSARGRSLLFLIVVLGLVAASAVAIALRPTVLGLDLQGGVEVVLQGKPTPESPVTPEAISRSQDIIRSRVDRFGVAEPEIQTQNQTQIAISLPGAKDPDKVVTDLIKPAQLTLYDYGATLVPLVGADGSQSASSPDLYQVAKFAGGVTPRNPATGAASFYLFRTTPQHPLVTGPETTRVALLQSYSNRVLPGMEVVKIPKGLVIVRDKQFLNPSKPDSPFQYQYSVLQDTPSLRGRDIAGAQQTFNQGALNSNEPIVALEFTGEGRKKFAAVTKTLAQRGRASTTDPQNPAYQSFAIVLDRDIVTNPIINFNENPNGINSDRAQIEGNFTLGSARTLADQINSGALPITFDVISQRQVSATLGKQSLRQGLIAGAIGLLLVMIFLVAYYRLLGLVADLALLIYGILFYAVIVLVPITLTLPGIAGMILTIGVAADANVVIFERIREEARAGRSARAAILGGYSKGISAIIDANVVTLATAAILFLFATSGVKGFAFTLFVGVILSLFTAVLATRAVFGLLADTKLFRNERLMGTKMREIHWKLDFVGKWKLWMAISFVPMVIGAFVIGINGLNLGLDFTSGTRIHTSFLKGQPTEAAVRTVVSDLGYDAKIQATTEQDGKRGFQIQTKTLKPAQVNELKRALDTRLGGIDEKTYGIDLVGPSFGRQVIRNAIYAVLISFAVIILYLTVRFEYKLALPALLSVVHDVWLALSIYAITGREVTSATVAALLTILGYSLYDVVIVFDRIRENTRIMLRTPYRQIVNVSVHETLTRSIITSLTTVIPVAVLFIFGGDTLKDFAFALLVGILAGGLSSIAIAAPIAALWKEREPAERKREAKIRKRESRRFVDSDADVVDIDTLARAEAALEGQLERGDEPEPVGLLPGEPAEEPPPGAEPDLEPAQLPAGDGQPTPDGAEVPAGADVPVAEADDDAGPDAEAGAEAAPITPNGPTDGPPPPPQRERRHRQVQRKRRK